MLNNNPFFTVILPVYNAEVYLEKLIESILKQTFSDFELVIIDDGSTDKSAKICNLYTQKDKRIKYKYKSNGGVSSARNLGIKYAVGDYIIFVDSDDWIEDDAFLRYATYFKENSKLSLLIFGFTMEYSENENDLAFTVAPKNELLNRNDFFGIFPSLLKKNLIATPWNKVYRTDIIKNHQLTFPEIANEDIFFNMDYIDLVRNVQLIDTTFYHWNRSREDSETSRVNKVELIWSAKKQLFMKILDVTKNWDLSDEEIQNIYSYYTDRIVLIIQEIMKSSHAYSFKKSYIKKVITDPLTVELAGKSKSSSFIMRMCLIPIKLKSVLLSMLLGKLITLFKVHFATLFLKVKTKVVNESREVHRIV